MSLKSKITPRADFWRDQKVRKASKIWTTRALEQDKSPKKGAQAVQRRADAQAHWTRSSSLAADPVKDDI